MHMRTLCDACERAPAVLFCAADEAVLCRPCDEKVHKCNKLASRHLRVGLADPNDVPRCDLCEIAPAFFYCEVDGTSLCLQCDMVAHVGGKRTHGRYLVLRQRIEFPGDKTGEIQDPVPEHNDLAENGKKRNRAPKFSMGENQQNHTVSLVQKSDANGEKHVKAETNMIDLNMKPHYVHEYAPENQDL